MKKVIAAIAGLLLLGLGIFFVSGQESHKGTETSATASGESAETEPSATDPTETSVSEQPDWLASLTLAGRWQGVGEYQDLSVTITVEEEETVFDFGSSSIFRTTLLEEAEGNVLGYETEPDKGVASRVTVIADALDEITIYTSVVAKEEMPPEEQPVGMSAPIPYHRVSQD